MSEPFIRQQETFELDRQPDPKRGCGCSTVLIACLGCVVAILAAIWITFMHTSVPLRFVANLIEKGSAGSHLKLTGLSGTLSSGLNFKKITWVDGELSDVRLRYSGLMDIIRRDELIIYEMHVGSALIHKDSQSDPSRESQADAAAGPTEPSPKSPGSSTELPMKRIQIDRVSLNKVTIKDRSTGTTIEIPKIEWTGFKAAQGTDVEWGDLFADSDHLVIQTSNPAGSVFQKHFAGSLLPKLDERILKPIHIEALVSGIGPEAVYEISAFDGTIVMTRDPSGNRRLQSKEANLAEFLDAPLPNQLTFEASESTSANGENIKIMTRGSFLLGTKAFEIQPLNLTSPKGVYSNPSLHAIHQSGETEIHYEMLMNRPGLKANLVCTPDMSPENLLALIYHDLEFSKLSAPDQEKIRKHMAWFTFNQ